jgi:Pyruvate/2-oxoacid:ferredoxin oxidoreductase delta subunit
MEGGLPVIDLDKGPNLIPAVHKCPQHCFVDKAPFRSKVSITPACDGCELCKKACPVKAIEGESGLKHRVVLDQCIGCGLCTPVCPRKAIVAMGALGYAETSRASRKSG